MRRSAPLRLTDAQRKLVEDNVGLVGYVMQHYGHQGLGFSDDTFQTGIVGLMRAAARYDSSRSAFSTFAVTCILNELRREAHYQSGKRRGGGIRFVSLDMPLTASDQMLLDEMLCSDVLDLEDRMVRADVVKKLLDLLDLSVFPARLCPKQHEAYNHLDSRI